MGVKKNIEKLMKEPTEMRLDEIIGIMIYLGYTINRIHGSHYQFIKPNERLVTIPSHKSKVAKHYLKLVKNIIIKYSLLKNYE